MKVSAGSTIRRIKKNDFVWRFGSNFSSSLGYGLGLRERLDNAEIETIKHLNDDGIAVSSIESLPGLNVSLDEICAAAKKLIDESGECINKLRRSASDEDRVGSKTFNLEMLGSQLLFDPHSIFARFALNQVF